MFLVVVVFGLVVGVVQGVDLVESIEAGEDKRDHDVQIHGFVAVAEVVESD